MDDVAIVGMACIFPGAPDIRTFWQNIVSKADCISDPPDDWEGYPWYDPDSNEPDRTYVKRAGYLKDLSRFDPFKYGIIPKAVDGAEPEHWLSLKVAYETLADAGVPDIPINREKTEVIMGRGLFVNRGYITISHYSLGIDQTLDILKELFPDCSEESLQKVKRKLQASIPTFSPDTAPGLVSSIMAGRIANRLDLQGSSYAVDAACSSSLLAVERGCYDLLSGRCDAALVGGINLAAHHQNQMLLCRLGAASRSQEIRPFDQHANGMLMGEGVGMVLLKRRQDAERDGNRIYALIRGAGSASDGAGASVIAPRVEGEELAIRRAYENAHISPDTVELIEAHGTGIPLGDATEVAALTRVFGARSGDGPRCAIGSVKSMIGHLLPASGMAGLIKAALAVYHRTLPPTLRCSRPHTGLNLGQSPFYINTETRPWIHGASKDPRRAGVNAFGFGGSDAHIVLEEYCGAAESTTEEFHSRWETELFVIQADSRDGLIAQSKKVAAYVEGFPSIALKDLAYTVNRALTNDSCRLAVVASSGEELKKKLEHTVDLLKNERRQRIKDRSGIYYFDAPLGQEGKLAFLFPGEGSQYVNMLSDLCIHFPEVRSCFDLLGKACAFYPELNLYRDAIFPPPAFSEEEKQTAEAKLWEMDNAITAVMTADKALLTLLQLLKIKPDALVGHSSGELFTLTASGISELSSAREDYLMGYLLLGHRMIQRVDHEQAIPDAPLVTVGAVDRPMLDQIVAKSGGELIVAMDNCPNQVVLCCRTKGAADIYLEQLRKQGAICQVLPFSRPYHTPLFEPARPHLEELFDWGTFSPPAVEVYSCMTAAPFPSESREIRRFGIEQWLNPVRFRETIEAMYHAGVRLFLEVGPKSQLTGFVNDTLKEHNHLAVAVNAQHRSGITQLHHALGLLAAHGVSMDLGYLYQRRKPQLLDLETIGAEGHVHLSPEPLLSLSLPILSLKGVTRDWFMQKPALPGQPDRHDANINPAYALSLVSSEAADAVVTPTAPVQLEIGSPPSARPLFGQLGAQHGSDNGRKQVMGEYFQTMERFLEDQKSVFQAYLNRRRGGSEQASSAAPSRGRLSYHDIVVGQCAEYKRMITEDDARKFRKVSGNDNQAHGDESHAHTTASRKEIVYGMMAFSYISTVLGTKLPGPGSVYLKQDYTFKSPVRVGDEITARVDVIAKDDRARSITLATVCLNQHNQVVVEGQAVVGMWEAEK